ncbi:hypothetical protein LguiA_014279 [Lonicera macranthoides]
MVKVRSLWMWMLQVAGNPHFCVTADQSSYQEERQKNVMGKIWDEAGTKLVCAAFSSNIVIGNLFTIMQSLSYCLVTENPDQIGEKNLYSINPRLKAFSDWLLQVMMSGNLDAISPASNCEYAPLVEELWKGKAFQATYFRADYEPSDIGILYGDCITSSKGISCMFPKLVHFSFLGPVDQTEPLQSSHSALAVTDSLESTQAASEKTAQTC